MESILIIGGTRYLGFAITRLLARESGYPVCVLNRGRTQAQAALPGGVRHVIGDTGNLKALIATVNDINPTIVIDTILSASALAMLLPALSGGVKRFIHTGSIGVYGDTRYLPAREDDAADPKFPVFREKLAQDEIVLSQARRQGLSATILRISYIFGRGDIPLELWGGRNPEFFQRLQRGEPIPVPGDGHTLLHPGHVEDLAQAFLLCLQRENSVGQVYNIGGERSVTLKHYVNAIGQAMEKEPCVEWGPMDSLMPLLVGQGLADREGLLFLMEHMAVDISKARRELGYQPQISLEEGMRDNIQWMKEKGLLA